MDDSTIVAGLKSWCEMNSVPLGGVLVITIQENCTTEFTSLVVDMDNEKVLPNFPADALTSYKEIRLGSLLVCYKAGLVLPNSFSTDASLPQHEAAGPFGCAPSELTPYKHRSTANDCAFRDFVQGSGHHPNLIFEVKKQVDNGPLLSTKYYQLKDGVVTEVQGPFTQKVHSFKNYKCASKDLFFGVDLYRADQSAGGNYHHMRLNPFTKLNPEILGSFFANAM